MVGSVSPRDRVTVKKVIAMGIIPQEKYEKSKRLFLNNARKVSFDSFLNWLKLGDNVSLIVVPNAGEVPEKREYLIPS